MTVDQRGRPGKSPEPSLTGASCREPPQHTWPWLKKIPTGTPCAARVRSASGKTMFADLPPSSSDSFFRCQALAATIVRPVCAEPAKAILATPGWSISACPAHRADKYPGRQLHAGPGDEPGRLDHDLHGAEAARRRAQGELAAGARGPFEVMLRSYGPAGNTADPAYAPPAITPRPRAGHREESRCRRGRLRDHVHASGADGETSHC